MVGMTVLMNWWVITMISAKTELEKYFGITLHTEDKLLCLSAIEAELEEELGRVTNRNQRIVALAKKQVIEECSDMLLKYYSTKSVLGGEE